MEIVDLEIDAVKLVRPRRFADARGFFVETWNRKAFAAAGIDVDFVQDNASWSRAAATIRGLHFQRAPRVQAKLVRVVRGRAFDVAVDLRRGSPSFACTLGAR
jgi:dTDP-4-dehydrorhamnose 3,5-epimerase